MNTLRQKFGKDIENECLWYGTKYGRLVFPIMIIAHGLLTFGLWQMASHDLLLVWFAAISSANLLRLIFLEYFHRHRDALRDRAANYKCGLVVCALLTSGCWILGVLWFFDPAKPATVMIIGFAIIFESVGGILTWMSYLPAVILITFPPALLAITMMLLYGGDLYFAAALVQSMFPFGGTLFSIKVNEILHETLYLNFENAALRRDAELANAAKTRFLAAASHDLRQPIHALGLFFAELKDRVWHPETAGVIGQIEDSIAAITSMLNALLDVSKLDAGVVKPEIESIALTGLFERLQTEFRPMALEHHNELTVRPSNAWVRTDPLMLERMLRNLIGNALRYTENGRVLVAARARGGNIAIRVLDNGPGVPKARRDDIFIEFYQLQNPARDRRQGLGLGLAIVKRLAKLLGHEVKLMSRLGRGACFTLIVESACQAMDLEPATSDSRELRPNFAFTGRQVLILDDDIAVLDGMKGLMQRWGCHVLAAVSLGEAVDALAEIEQSLDLLIVDYRLADSLSGIEAAKKLQRLLGYPVAVLLITGDTGPERLREAASSGFPLLHKPVQPAKLRSTLQYLLEKPQLQ